MNYLLNILRISGSELTRIELNIKYKSKCYIYMDDGIGNRMV